MNRREFMAASLGGVTALVALRIEEFMAWWRAWLGTPERAAATVGDFDRMMKKIYSKQSLMNYSSAPGFSFLYLSPRDYDALRTEFA